VVGEAGWGKIAWGEIGYLKRTALGQESKFGSYRPMSAVQRFLSLFWRAAKVCLLVGSWHVDASFGSPLILSHVVEIPPVFNCVACKHLRLFNRGIPWQRRLKNGARKRTSEARLAA